VAIAAVLPATVLIGTLLVAGCATSPAPRAATTDTCFAFAVRSLERHQTVTHLPAACAGLTREQVNTAVGRALREVVGPLAKVPFRRRALADSRYLAGLVRSVPATRPAARRAAARSSPGLPASLAALAAWIATATAGLYLLAGWLGRTPSGKRRFRAAGLPPAVLGSHAGLGIAGLGVWIAFTATGEQALGWIAVGTTFLLAGLGMATLLSATADPPRPDPLVPDDQRSATATATTTRAGVRAPVLVIALHGVLATTTILLVLLAVIGSG
jgi:hypothetical protein